MRWISRIRNVNIWMMEKDHKRCQTRWEKNDPMCSSFCLGLDTESVVFYYHTIHESETINFHSWCSFFVPDNLLDADITFLLHSQSCKEPHFIFFSSRFQGIFSSLQWGRHWSDTQETSVSANSHLMIIFNKYSFFYQSYDICVSGSVSGIKA